MIIPTIKLQLSDALERNISANTKYFDYEYKVFYELELVVHEIGKCLILKLNYAAITVTNHFLERLLKLALIHKSVGIGPKALQQLDNIFAVPTEKYGSLSLGNSIEQCKKEDLLDSEERDFLFEFVRDVIRNGFSHGDAKKVLSEMPDEKQYYHAMPGNTEWTEMTFNPKLFPQVQSAHMESFANENAPLYSNYTFQLMQRIESRLIGFRK